MDRRIGNLLSVRLLARAIGGQRPLPRDAFAARACFKGFVQRGDSILTAAATFVRAAAARFVHETGLPDIGASVCLPAGTPATLALATPRRARRHGREHRHSHKGQNACQTVADRFEHGLF